MAFRQAFNVASVVGPILVLFNNADHFWARSLPRHFVVKSLLTLVVPFFVSLYSSLRMMKFNSGNADLAAAPQGELVR